MVAHLRAAVRFATFDKPPINPSERITAAQVDEAMRAWREAMEHVQGGEVGLASSHDDADQAADRALADQFFASEIPSHVHPETIDHA